MDFKLGDVYQDASVLKAASEAADWLLKNKNEWFQEMSDYEGTSSVII